MARSIEIICSDITTLEVDAIVNAAAPSLLGGGGVDGAIHAAAGPDLLRACQALPTVSGRVRCPTGHARITPGFRLPAKFVIHTVGPIWSNSDQDRIDLANCYINALALAAEHAITSIAFPAISTGAYGFPASEAAAIAVRELARGLRTHPHLDRLIACCFDDRTVQIYQRAIQVHKEQ